MEVLTKMARQGAEKYIDAQKRLLELAIEESTPQKQEVMAGRGNGSSRRLIREELTEKGVKNLVAAEKSLLDLAIRPKRGMAREETRKAGPQGRGRRVHVRTRKTAK